MVKLLLVGFGGFAGSVCRYLLSGWVQGFSWAGVYPWGTWVVNVAGCLLIGFLGGLAENRGIFSGQTRIFLLVGFLGGFTTFSTFCSETFALMEGGQFLAAFVNVAGSVLVGVTAVLIGFRISGVL